MSEFIENDSFVIDTDAKAEWALQKIREARADRDRFVKWYMEKIKEIKEQCDFNTMNLERMLKEYFETVPHRETKAQSIYDLPTGKLYFKNQNPEYKHDDKTVIDWLKKNGGNQFIEVEESLKWGDLKKAGAVVGGKMFTEDGEEIPGIEVINKDPVFCVEV